MKKRILSIILALAMMFSLAAVTSITASAEEYGDFEYYELDDYTIEISSYYGEGGDVVIPDEIDGKTVTAIGFSAFEFESEITSIVIPNSVTKIYETAFFGCKALADITIGDNVGYIGYEAFDDTAYYNNAANWQDGVLYLGNYLLSGSRYTYDGFIADELIESVTGDYTIKDGTTIIADLAFYECEELTGITVPSGMKVIGDHAFGYCSKLQSISLPDTIESVGVEAFNQTAYYLNTENWENGILYIGNCLVQSELITIDDDYNINYVLQAEGDVVIKNGTKAIAEGAFISCEKLTGVTIPGSVKQIDQLTFEGCDKLKSVTFNNGTEIIGYQAFGYCKSLENVVLPVGLKYIDSEAFLECENLKNIAIPNSVIYIGECALGYYIEIDDEMGDWYNKPISDFHIDCYKDTAAEQYAIDNGFDYTSTSADYGDANNDGNIDMLDVLLIRKYIAKQPIDLDISIADVTCDGSVDMLDVLLIRKYIAKQPVTLGPQK